MSQLVRMPDQFTPGRGARAAATPTCSSCCCCCCCVVSLIASSVVLPVSAARAVRQHDGYGPDGSPVALPARSPVSRALGYLLLALTPLATLGVMIGLSALTEIPEAAVVAGGLAGIGLALAGDQLVGRPRAGLSVALLAMFAGLFLLELFVSVALLQYDDGVYAVVAIAAVLVVLVVYLWPRRRRPR